MIRARFIRGVLNWRVPSHLCKVDERTAREDAARHAAKRAQPERLRDVRRDDAVEERAEAGEREEVHGLRTARRELRAQHGRPAEIVVAEAGAGTSARASAAPARAADAVRRCDRHLLLTG